MTHNEIMRREELLDKVIHKFGFSNSATIAFAELVLDPSCNLRTLEDLVKILERR